MNDKAPAPDGIEVFKRIVKDLGAMFPQGLQTASRFSLWSKSNAEQSLPRARLKNYSEHHSPSP